MVAREDGVPGSHCCRFEGVVGPPEDEEATSESRPEFVVVVGVVLVVGVVT